MRPCAWGDWFAGDCNVGVFRAAKEAKGAFVKIEIRTAWQSEDTVFVANVSIESQPRLDSERPLERDVRLCELIGFSAEFQNAREAGGDLCPKRIHRCVIWAESAHAVECCQR